MQLDSKPKLTDAVRLFNDLPDDALIQIDDIARLLNLGVSTCWRRAKKDPNFPKLVRLGARCTRARVADVRAYLRGESKASTKAV